MEEASIKIFPSPAAKASMLDLRTQDLIIMSKFQYW